MKTIIVGVGPVDPESERRAVVRIAERDAGEAVVVAFEVGEAVVEYRRAHRPRGPKVVLGAVDGRRPSGKIALIGQQYRVAGTRRSTGSTVAVPSVR